MFKQSIYGGSSGPRAQKVAILDLQSLLPAMGGISMSSDVLMNAASLRATPHLRNTVLQ